MNEIICKTLRTFSNNTFEDEVIAVDRYCENGNHTIHGKEIVLKENQDILPLSECTCGFFIEDFCGNSSSDGFAIYCEPKEKTIYFSGSMSGTPKLEYTNQIPSEQECFEWVLKHNKSPYSSIVLRNKKQNERIDFIESIYNKYGSNHLHIEVELANGETKTFDQNCGILSKWEVLSTVNNLITKKKVRKILKFKFTDNNSQYSQSIHDSSPYSKKRYYYSSNDFVCMSTSGKLRRDILNGEKVVNSSLIIKDPFKYEIKGEKKLA